MRGPQKSPDSFAESGVGVEALARAPLSFPVFFSGNNLDEHAKLVVEFFDADHRAEIRNDFANLKVGPVCVSGIAHAPILHYYFPASTIFLIFF